MSKLPTEVLYIQDPDNANDEILEFAKDLEARGERAWFEIRYPAPALLSEEDKKVWWKEQDNFFDAVEVIDGEIHTLPPYVELEAADE